MSDHYGPETSEFHREFAAQTDKLLRRRLLWFIGIWGGLGLLGMIPAAFAMLDRLAGWGAMHERLVEVLTAGDAMWPYAVSSVLWLGGYGSALYLAVTNRLTRQHALWASLALITLDGLYGITMRLTGSELPSGLMFFTISHFVASLVFPWSARQAVIPAAIVLGVNAVSRLVFEVEGGNYTPHVLAVLFSPLLAVPGTLVAWGRHSRRLGQYRYTFVQKRYGSLRQELAYARAIHESLFPNPCTDEDVCFTYRYEPMRQIGGDYLYTSFAPADGGTAQTLSLVLLDVTGHGIPAALTVNRLHGEIELMFADDPLIDPGRVLSRLNRYVHLTLARHSIYVTGLCLRVDPVRGTLEYASGGHPPAFLRGSDGTLEDLGSTAFVLGACAGRDFDPAPITRAFGPGDSLIAYTDGATEARTETGQMLRIEGMRRLLADRARGEPGRWPERLLDAVTHHREGLPPEDDTLVVEVFRPLGARVEPARAAEARVEQALPG